VSIPIRMPVVQLLRVPMLLEGDSTTYGTGNQGLAYRPYLLARLRPPYLVDFVGPFKSIFPNTTEIDQDHAGIPSDVLSNMNSRIVGEIAAYHPRIILLQGGVNELASGITPANTLTLLQTTLTTIYAQDPTIVTMCCQLPCDPASPYYGAVTTYNPGVAGVVSTRQAAGQLVSSVDNFTGVACGAADVHPTDAGYQTVAARWAAGLLAYPPALAALGAPV
jgi:lysophospholipase L1-like esterase